MSVVNVKNFTYNTNDLIGKGATGSVYKGVDSYNGRAVAIKAIKMTSINNQVTKYLLENEIKALQVVDHPNVINNYDIVRNRDFTYIVMEYCSSNLSDLIKANKAIPEDKAMELFKQIVEGYRSIQEQRIVHRDLKPSNILLTSDLIPKVSDFGYCEIEGYLAKPKMFYNVGSPSYMAPEAITKNMYSQKSDIWALGTILYEMLNGQTYDKGKQVMDAIMMINKRGITHVKLISQPTQQIIRECLTFDHSKRANLSRLRDLLGLQRNHGHGNANTSFYRDESVIVGFHQPSFISGPQQNVVVKKIDQFQQNSFYESPTKQLPVNRSNAVFRSLVIPSQSHLSTHTEPHPQPQQKPFLPTFISQKPKAPLIQQNIPNIPLTPPVTNAPTKSNIHQILQNPKLREPATQRTVIAQQQHPISHVSGIEKPRNNAIHFARRSIIRDQKRYMSVSPRKHTQPTVNIQSFPRRRTVHLNTSIDEISPQFLTPTLPNRGTIIKRRL